MMTTGSCGSSPTCQDPVDHVLVSGSGPHYVPFAELDAVDNSSGRRADRADQFRLPAWRGTYCGPQEASC